MSLLTKLPDRLCEWFSDMQQFSGCTFYTRYPPESKATPLINPILVVGVSALDITEYTIDDTNELITDSRPATEEFLIGIHVPRSMGAQICELLLDDITDMLLFHTTLAITELHAGAAVYVRNTDSYYLETTFKVREMLQRSDIYPAELTL